jgi:hypothetical protein
MFNSAKCDGTLMECRKSHVVGGQAKWRFRAPVFPFLHFLPLASRHLGTSNPEEPEALEPGEAAKLSECLITMVSRVIFVSTF